MTCSSRSSGHAQERPIARLEERRSHRALVGALYRDVGDVDGLPMQGRPARHALPLGDRRGASDRVQRRPPPAGPRSGSREAGIPPRPRRTRDRAAVGPGELIRAGDDRVEHRVEVERRADRAADLAQRRELLHRARQLGRPRPSSCEQPDVLDGDDRLVGESFEEHDLLAEKG